MTTLGVLSDTHVPDRVRALKPWILPLFREYRVDAILHAGDVCVPQVLEQLQEIAPVYAVRGNRDYLQLRHLPVSLRLEFDGVTIGLTHGHGTWKNYVVDKGYIIRYGLQPERYLQRALLAFPGVQAIVFGHTHLPVNTWVDGVLCLNPGSACCPDTKHPTSSVGVVHIQAGGGIEAEIIGFS